MARPAAPERENVRFAIKWDNLLVEFLKSELAMMGRSEREKGG
jgi:hypothetical protein